MVVVLVVVGVEGLVNPPKANLFAAWFVRNENTGEVGRQTNSPDGPFEDPINFKFKYDLTGLGRESVVRTGSGLTREVKNPKAFRFRVLRGRIRVRVTVCVP